MINLRSYFVDGEAKDQEWIIEHREMLEHYLRQDMREHGWIPSLDQSVRIVWEYVQDTNTFKYKMEAKGQKVGKKKAMASIGILSDGIVVGVDASSVTVAA